MFASLKTYLAISIQLAAVLAIVLTFANVTFGQAQAAAADLQGVVKDATGAVVPNATVTARNPATNLSRNATTNDEGFYRIVNLTPGDYEITVEATNFKRAVLPRVTVTVGQSAVRCVGRSSLWMYQEFRPYGT
jgi:hypothetical protein